MSLLFVPLSPSQLREWALSGVLAGPITAHVVSDGLVEAFGLTDPEEAERVVLLVASISGLITSGVRLVAVAEGPVKPVPNGDRDFGEVAVADLGFDSVRSLFADDAEVAAIAEAAAAVAGRTLADAWDQPGVAKLIGAADLLWHGRGEWESLAN